jgi:Icc-related predicted phosphoesterase
LGRTLWQKKQQGQDWTSLLEHTLLVCTDTHTRMLLPEMDVPRAVAWLHGGDFYLRKGESQRRRPVGGEGMKEFQSKKAAFDRWHAQRDIPLYAVRGNHDVTDPWDFFKRFRDLSGRIEAIAPQLWVAGLGWSGERFYQLPQEKDLESICEQLTEQLAKGLPQDSCLVILSHYPAVTDLCSGFACINRLMARWRPVVFIQGHIHETFKQQTVLSWDDGSQTLVFNPGPGGGVLTLQPEAGTARFAPI